MTRLFSALAPFGVWAAQFGILYGIAGLACARGFAGARLLGYGAIPFLSVIVTTLALTVVAALFVAALRRSRASEESASDRYLRRLATASAALMLVAIAWTAVPATLLPACS